jgi:tRNA U55 pseudouridine synthase TruB
MRRTIAVNAQTHAEVKTLSKTLNMELGEFVKHSVVYFKKTGIDPSKSENESPVKIMKELEKRVGQVVAYIKTHEQEKLNPLVDQLISLTRKLDEALKKLPASERFDQVIKGVNHHANLLVDSHKKQMDFLRESQQKFTDENKRELAALVTQQKAIKEAIETKLKSKLF